MRLPLAAILLVLSSLGTACGDAAVAGVRITLAADLSGTLALSGLHLADAAGPLEGKTAGITIDTRAALACARGTFAALAAVKVADVTFAAGAADDGLHWLRVVLPRGDGAQWPMAFTPARADRERVQQAFDPHRELGGGVDAVRIVVDLPGPVVSHGVAPKARGVASDGSGKRATLLVPVDRAFASGEAFEWHVTWR